MLIDMRWRERILIKIQIRNSYYPVWVPQQSLILHGVSHKQELKNSEALLWIN